MTRAHKVPPITISQARAHNLQGIDLRIPHQCLVVITGVSGSGKSTLAFDTVCREGQRLYLESFSTRARQLLGKLGQAEVQSIGNLSPAIALDQKTTSRNPRSTVGTISDLHNHLRLLFARLGGVSRNESLNRGDFSFNGSGACEACRGLGVQDRIDPELLVDDPSRTLRQGALVITTDSGYLIYSQVTMDVLNQVCQAHGFHVDIPWRDLTAEQKKIILYGSERLEIPFGKHTLESRLKWSGITARPRQTGYYGGIIPVMEKILDRDRNKNILRFARTGPCSQCGGTRLNERARSVIFAGKNIAELGALTIAQLAGFFESLEFEPSQSLVGEAIRGEVLKRTSVLIDLGIGYLTLDRAAPSLSGGEAQRVRLSTIVGSGLRGITYVLDEPSIGIHPAEMQHLLKVLHRLVDQGNSVLVVEHDSQTIMAADWVIDIGPGAGRDGGRVLFEGTPQDLLAESTDPLLLESLTRSYLRGEIGLPVPTRRPGQSEYFLVPDAQRNNLQHLEVRFPLGALTVISGVSGAGKSSLLGELAEQVKRAREKGGAPFRKLVVIDQTPIGRTPRSNAATYTGLFDPIRSLFAAQPQARQLGLGKGSFSFNNKGGRCPDCEGAGVQRLGMHFLGDVEILCDTCEGRRFDRDILRVTYQGLNISEVLDLPIAEASTFFAGIPRIHRFLEVLVELGLGYLSLGQPSTTFSGGEAQRIKLAAELSRPQALGSLYLFDEPTTGLHGADLVILLTALDKLVAGGGTVVVSEHTSEFLRFADQIIDLGPGSGDEGGRIVYSGDLKGLLQCRESRTGQALKKTFSHQAVKPRPRAQAPDSPIELLGVRTHNLKNLDVRFPRGMISVVTGVSGSGKSSLVFDTLHAEGRARYAENFSTYIRQQLAGRSLADLHGSQGLTPTVAIGQVSASANPRSTVATSSEIHPFLRLLLSRTGRHESGFPNPPAGTFSFNHHQGACTACRGLGSLVKCDPEKLVTNPDCSLLDGALAGHQTGRFYGEKHGQYIATLRQVGQKLNLDFTLPWSELAAGAKTVAMQGTGECSYDVVWEFERGKNKGEHHLNCTWPGFCALVNAEYERKHADQRGGKMLPVMSREICSTCGGTRYQDLVLEFTCAGLSIADLCALSIDEAHGLFAHSDAEELAQVPQLRDELVRRLHTMQRLGLGYLALDRASRTLSSGEQRRLGLARQLGSGLQGLTYVIDEPTLGLHPKDVGRLWQVVVDLRDQGNTVVLVEHDPWVIMAADHIIDLGPGSGDQGGYLVAQGTPRQIMNDEDSLTGRYLRDISQNRSSNSHLSEIPAPAFVRIQGARCNNLKGIDVAFPTGCLTAVTGVSGSGKTSLVFGVLAASAQEGLPVACDRLQGLEIFQSVVPIRQQVVSKGTGTTATVAGLAGPIRNLLAHSEVALAAGLTSRHFSTAQRGGRCENCQGQGRLKVVLDFLADVHTPCPECNGQGFTDSVLECRWQDRNISDIMALTLGQAREVFREEKKLVARLHLLNEVGLSGLILGQATASMSGGERQRLHLACHLFPGSGKKDSLILCDEPTAGLHPADIQNLCGLLDRLTQAGHTVVVTEHNQQLINQADLVLELGPGAGPEGGFLLK